MNRISIVLRSMTLLYFFIGLSICRGEAGAPRDHLAEKIFEEALLSREANQTPNSQGPEISPGKDKKNGEISQNVLNVIQREMSNPGPKIQEQDAPQLEKILQTFSAPKRTHKAGIHPTKQIVKAFRAHLGKGISGVVRGFDFIPSFEENQRWSDDGNGELTIEEPLHSESGVLRGKILADNLVVTTSDLFLEREETEQFVPVLDREDLFNFFEKENLQAIGGLVLVDLSENIDSTHIDVNYEAKYVLDENFRPVKRDELYRYELYVGVTPGNALLQVLTLDGLETEKIIFVEDQELLYEALVLRPSVRTTLELYEEKVLGKKSTELNIPNEQVKIFNSEYVSKSVGVNLYELESATRPRSMRNYFELTHLGHPIVLGLWDKTKATIPSKDFVSQVFEAFEISDLKGRCLIQINPGAKVKSVLASGKDETGSMNSYIYFLDSDGYFSETPSDLTTKAYLLGEGQGTMSVRVQYQDDSVDFIQSYCADESYVLEVL